MWLELGLECWVGRAALLVPPGVDEKRDANTPCLCPPCPRFRNQRAVGVLLMDQTGQVGLDLRWAPHVPRLCLAGPPPLWHRPASLRPTQHVPCVTLHLSALGSSPVAALPATCF